MSTVLEKIKQSMTAGQVVEIGIAGSFFRIGDCTWPVTVKLKKQGAIIGSMNSMVTGDYSRGVEFDTVIIVNGSLDQDITFTIASGSVGTDSVIGQVAVIDGNLARVKANQANMGFVLVGLVAGQNAIAQLWNQVGSGKNLIVTGVEATSSQVGAVNLSWSSTALANDAGVTAKWPKLIGAGGTLAAQVRTENQAAPFFFTMKQKYVTTAGLYVEFDFKEPLVVPPGKGLIVMANVQAQTLSTNFNWVEEFV